MPRVKKLPPTEAASAMAAFVGTSRGRSGSTGLVRYVREVKAMMESEQWTKGKASHLVALYYVLHEMVYGVAPELKGEELKEAKLAAGSFLHSKCADDFEAAVEFMRWVWARERSREQWRRDNKIDGKVLGWRLILRHSSMYTEYRVAMERRKHG